MTSVRNIILILQFASLSSLSGQTTTARFLLWHPSARSIALGGAGAATTNGAFSVFYNPAGLAFAKRFSIVGSLGRPVPFFDNTYHFFSAVSLHGNAGTIAISTNQFWRERQVRTAEFGGDLGLMGEEFDYFKPMHWEAKISIAALLSNNSSFGFNLSVLRIKLSSLGASAEGGSGKRVTGLFGCGFLVNNIFPGATFQFNRTFRSGLAKVSFRRQPSEGFSIGGSIINVGPKIMFIDADQSDQPPTIATLGIAYLPLAMNVLKILLTADFEKQIHESSKLDYIHLGNEIIIANTFSIRRGYFLDTYGPKNSYNTWGFGLSYRFLNLDVARYKQFILPTWRVDCSITVGL